MTSLVERNRKTRQANVHARRWTIKATLCRTNVGKLSLLQKVDFWPSSSRCQVKVQQHSDIYNICVFLLNSSSAISLPILLCCSSLPPLSTPSRLTSYMWPPSREDCQQQVKDRDPPHKESLPSSRGQLQPRAQIRKHRGISRPSTLTAYQGGF